MRVAILADIHGNLPACEAVLEDIAKAVAPDFIVAAGDLALRGAHPAETVELLFDRCDALIMGNTDCYIAGNYLGGAYRERDHWKTELLAVDAGSARRVAGSSAWGPCPSRCATRRAGGRTCSSATPTRATSRTRWTPRWTRPRVRRYFQNLDAAACAFGHLHFPYRRRVGRMLIADVASAGIPRDGDLRPAYGVFTFTPKGWRVQIRRVRYPVRKATQALTSRRVPGGPLLIHKLVEARYRHHKALMEAARRHSGLPPPGPVLRPPPGVHLPHAASPVESVLVEPPLIQQAPTEEDIPPPSAESEDGPPDLSPHDLDG